MFYVNRNHLFVCGGISIYSLFLGLLFHIPVILGAKSRHWVGPNTFYWNDRPPTFRSGHGIALLENQMFLFGGYGPSGNFSIF